MINYIFKTLVFIFIICALVQWPSTVLSLGNDPLVNAIQKSNYNKVANLLEQGRNPNYRLPDNSLPLTWAVETQDLELVNMLIAAGAQPDDKEKNSNPYTPLIVACHLGNESIINVLLEAGADVNILGPEGVAPISICSRYSSPFIVKKLLKLGANANHADNSGQTPLMFAAIGGKSESIKALLDAKAKPNYATQKGLTPLFFALKGGNSDASFLLVKAGADPSYVAPDGTTTVQMAMYQKVYDFAEWLVEQGVDINSFDRNGNQLLHVAVRENQTTLVKKLLDAGANPNAETGVSTVKWRYESNFKTGDYEEPITTPLLLAAEKGSVEMMSLLVKAGADPSYRTKNKTNVVLAATTKSPDALEYALQLQPNPNVVNANGQTPLHLLLNGGTDYEITDQDLVKMFKLLAVKGAKTDIKDSFGVTSAQLATNDNFRAKTAFGEIFSVTQP